MHTVRQRHPSRHLFIGALLVALLAAMFPLAPAGAQSADDEILVVGKTLGFRHSHIDDTTNVLIDMGATNGFSVDVWDPRQPDLTLDSTPFTSAADLAKYATIVFVSPVDGTNNQDPARPRLLDDDELAAFQGYIHDGGGFVGLHAATDAMHAIPWYSQLTGGGARFRNHPAQQTATMRVESPAHPSTEILPLAWERFDEWYNFTTNPREDVHVLLTLDESTYNGGSMGDDHPIAWCQNFEGGRSWYEGAGHTDASYTDPLFVEHLLKGIEWTAGVVNGGGNCVTFDEVDELVDGVDATSRPAQVGLRLVAQRLDAAETAADAGDRGEALKQLHVAETLSRALLHDDGLATKVADLSDWQQGLADAGM